MHQSQQITAKTLTVDMAIIIMLRWCGTSVQLQHKAQLVSK